MGTWLLVALACGLDRLVGDPRRWLHPVQVMGWVITGLRSPAETWAGDRPAALRLGVLITLLLVGEVPPQAWRWSTWLLLFRCLGCRCF